MVGGTPLGPLFLFFLPFFFSRFFFVFFLPFIFSFFLFFLFISSFFDFLMFFHFLSSCISFKYFFCWRSSQSLTVSSVVGAPWRCGVPDDIGRDRWDWVGPACLGESMLQLPRVGGGAPSPVKTEPPQIVLLLLLLMLWWWWLLLLFQTRP